MIYLDHHATTPVDARVLEAMLPFFTEKFGNAASKQHRFGWDANDAVERARKQVAALIGAGQQGHRLHERRDRGEQPRDQGRGEGRGADGAITLVTVATEHKAVLDPMRAAASSEGWRVDGAAGGRATDWST